MHSAYFLAAMSSNSRHFCLPLPLATEGVCHSFQSGFLTFFVALLILFNAQWIAPEIPPPPPREDDGISFTLDDEYEQALGGASEEELVDLAGKNFQKMKRSLAISWNT